MAALASILILAALAAESGVERPADASRLGLVAFQRIRIPDDVPAHLTTALAEDRDGFLWIGTQGGLVRFDGYEFKTFKPAPDDPGSLGGSYVRAVLATRDGRIWVGSFADGVSVYDPKRESFDRYRHDPSNPTSLSHDRVEALAEDADGASGLPRSRASTASIQGAAWSRASGFPRVLREIPPRAWSMNVFEPGRLGQKHDARQVLRDLHFRCVRFSSFVRWSSRIRLCRALSCRLFQSR